MKQQELDKLLEQHRRYANGEPVSPVSLQDEDLSGLRLEGCLQGLNLYGANLTGADLSFSSLAYSNLSRARLKNANLENASLRGASFRQSNLEGANLKGTQLQMAILNHAVLTHANLTETDLSGTHLSYAKLIGVAMTNAEALFASFKLAQIVDSDLKNTNFNYSDFSYATVSENQIHSTSFFESTFFNTNLIGNVGGKLESFKNTIVANTPAYQEIHSTREFNGLDSILGLRYPIHIFEDHASICGIILPIKDWINGPDTSGFINENEIHTVEGLIDFLPVVQTVLKARESYANSNKR